MKKNGNPQAVHDVDKIRAARKKYYALPKRKRDAIEQKKLNAKIHKSHSMTKWRHTVVAISDTPRFGKIRVCKACKHEQAVTVAGDGTHGELVVKCRGYEI